MKSDRKLRVSLKSFMATLTVLALLIGIGSTLLEKKRQRVIRRDAISLIVSSKEGLVTYREKPGVGSKEIRPTGQVVMVVLDDVESEDVAALNVLSEISHLTIRRQDIADLPIQITLPNLIDLTLFGSIRYESLFSPSTIENVETLTLIGDAADDQTIEFVNKFKNIHRLRILSSCKLRDEGLEKINFSGDLTKLTILEISNTKISASGVTKVLPFLNLDRLDLKRNDIDNTGAEQVRSLAPPDLQLFIREERDTQTLMTPP